MADEPRRSGRATKGQHKNASSSPAPTSKATKAAKSKPPKKSREPTPTAEAEYDDDDEVIRCICGNSDANDKRAFIGCDECSVWQHNVCMGIPDDEDDVPDSYLCEQCGPDDHRETLQAMAKGERIWEVRNKIYANEKKMSKNRKGQRSRAGWLKKDVPPEGEQQQQEEAVVEEPIPQEAGSKRKRGEDVKEETVPQHVVQAEELEEQKPTRGSTRQDKRRKSAPAPDPETALVDIDQLPADRQRVAKALSKILVADIKTRSQNGEYRVPDGHTPQSLGDHYAVRVEYEMTQNHEGTPAYKEQYSRLNANFKKNPALMHGLLDEILTAAELATMSSADMASDELQKERAAMKEALDRQAVAVQPEGPRYRRTHKGDELIEDLNVQTGEGGGGLAAPVRERTSNADAEMVDAGSPVKIDGPGSPKMQTEAPLRVDTRRRESMSGGHERRQSSQQFDMNNIWAKTAQSPTSSGTANPLRPMQQPARRRSSVPSNQQPPNEGGTKVDADIDRMLQDDEEETYSPADYTGEDGVVWRGELAQSGDGVSPTVNGRFVAGRDVSPTITWKDLIPKRLNIDGRLAIPKAEEYLCSLQWSTSSDVSVLALSAYDDAAGFQAVFEYFQTRQRYAVVNKDKPPMIKDLYIIPIEQGESLPLHVDKLEYCTLKSPAEEKYLLATLVVARAPDTPRVSQQLGAEAGQQGGGGGGVNGHHLPQHVRAAAGAAGPSGSPLNTSSATFSPTNTAGSQQPGYGAAAAGGPPTYPLNPYAPSASPSQAPAPAPTNPLITSILGDLCNAPTALQVITADPEISREKLEHLRLILEEDLEARTDIEALGRRLFIEGGG